MSDQKETDEKKVVTQIYAAFGAALILSFVPFFSAATLSMILGMGVLIAAYVIRSRAQDDSLADNHMTFIIRTIWIGSFFALISTAIGAIYLYLNLDNEPLAPCVSDLMAGAQNLINMGSLKDIFGDCYEPYWALNSRTFITSGVIVALPAVLYFSLRFIRGLSRAMNGYRVAKPLSWF